MIVHLYMLNLKMGLTTILIINCIFLGMCFALPRIINNPACPKPDGRPGICAFTCGSCPEGQICCPTSCGGTVCYTPKQEPRCPNGEREVNCFLNPCRFATCSNYPEAKCRADYCGGCIARFYVSGTEVTDKCTLYLPY